MYGQRSHGCRVRRQVDSAGGARFIAGLSGDISHARHVRCLRMMRSSLSVNSLNEESVIESAGYNDGVPVAVG